MSVVIDGFDLISKAAYPSCVMKTRLTRLLSGEKIEIPLGALHEVKDLFSVGRNCSRMLNGKKPSGHEATDVREAMTTYNLLIDMVTRVAARNGAPPNFPYGADSELESLAEEIQLLDSSGKRITENKDRYAFLRDVFEEICKIPRGYACGQRIRTKYSYGTFDDGDDD